MSAPLPIALAAAVPFRIAEYRDRGGPTRADVDRTRGLAEILAYRGDVLMFGGGRKGEVAQLFNELADAVAVMALKALSAKILADAGLLGK